MKKTRIEFTREPASLSPGRAARSTGGRNGRSRGRRARARTDIRIAKPGSPPIADSRSALTPQVGASTHEMGASNPAAARGRSASPSRARSDTRAGCRGRSRAGRGRTSPRARARAARARARPPGAATDEPTGVGDLERQVEDQPAPEQRRGQRVEADRGRRDRQRQHDPDERRRHRDRVLERPLPALPLDRAAGAEERRRPDAHHPGADRDEEERSGPRAGC